jgi:hypothetical protein
VRSTSLRGAELRGDAALDAPQFSFENGETHVRA